MAAGDAILDALGNVILDSSGNVMLSDGAGNACCAVCAPPECGCPDGKPASMIVTLSGITLAPLNSCVVCTTSGSMRVESSWSGGTYSLPYVGTDGTNCIWSVDVATPFVLKYWTTNNCTPGLLYTSVTMRLYLTRDVISGNWTLTVVILTQRSGTVGPQFGLFLGSGSSTDCGTGLPTITNTYTGYSCTAYSGGGLTAGTVGYDGSATLAV